jgi:hypothetical protein
MNIRILRWCIAVVNTPSILDDSLPQPTLRRFEQRDFLDADEGVDEIAPGFEQEPGVDRAELDYLVGSAAAALAENYVGLPY